MGVGIVVVVVLLILVALGDRRRPAVHASAGVGELVFAALTPDDHTFDNAPVLEAAIAESKNGVVWIKPGHYHFQTAPDMDRDSWAILGPAPAFHWQLTDVGGDNHAACIFEYHGTDTFIDVPVKLPAGRENLRGPYVIQNMMFLSKQTSGSFVQIGNPSDTERAKGHTRGVVIQGCVFSSRGQVWTPKEPLVDTGTTKVDRIRARESLIKLIKPYDLVLRDVTVRGGFTGIELIHADRPTIDGLHLGHQVFGLKHQSIDGYTRAASVPGQWSNIFLEGVDGCGIWSDASLIDGLRAENGYRREIGRYETPTLTAWSVAAGTDQVDLKMNGTPSDYFEVDMPIRLIGTHGREFNLLITEVDTDHLHFDRADDQCYFSRNASGKTVYRYFGFHFLGRGSRFHFSQAVVGYNEAFANLPIGFYVPVDSRAQFEGISTGIGNFDASNRTQIIAHCAGSQHHLGAGVDWFGGYPDFTPDHPLCYRIGWLDRDPNWSQAPIMNGGIRPGEYWHLYPGMSIGSANHEARECEFQHDGEGWYENWEGSSTGRRFYLYGMDVAASVRLKYRIRMKSSNKSPQNVRVLTEGGSRVLHARHAVGPSWDWYQDTITTTAFSTLGKPRIRFAHPKIHFSELIVERLD
jgi:hypothetical protein